MAADVCANAGDCPVLTQKLPAADEHLRRERQTVHHNERARQEGFYKTNKGIDQAISRAPFLRALR
jgi:isocitrate lyase